MGHGLSTRRLAHGQRFTPAQVNGFHELADLAFTSAYAPFGLLLPRALVLRHGGIAWHRPGAARRTATIITMTFDQFDNASRAVGVRQPLDTPRRALSSIALELKLMWRPGRVRPAAWRPGVDDARLDTVWRLGPCNDGPAAARILINPEHVFF
jgi:hypothetical protein